MANSAKKKEFKKPIQKEEPFVEEDSNKKIILLVSLSILVVLGLIMGSAYYFNNIENEEPYQEEPSTQIESSEDELIIKKPEVVKKPTYNNVEPVVVEVPEEEFFTVIFFDENEVQIGEPLKVKVGETELDYPVVPEREGYTHTWAGNCTDIIDTCSLQLTYIKTLVQKGEEVDTYDVDTTQNSVMVSGSVAYEEIERPNFEGTGFNNYIKIKFISPDGLSLSDLANMTVTVSRAGIEGGYTYTGAGLLDSNTEELASGNYYFFLEQAVDKGTTEKPKLIVDWDGPDGALDPFEYIIDLDSLHRINKAENNGIVVPYDDEEKESTGVGDVTYDIDLDESDNIVVDGTINNYDTKTGSMLLAGLDEFKHILTIKFTAPEGLTDFTNLKVVTTRSDGSYANYEGETILDGTNYFYLYQAVDIGTTDTPQIKIDWDGDGILPEEVYDIDLTSARLQLSKLSEGINEATIEETDEALTYELDLTSDRDGNEFIEVTGNINYYHDEEIATGSTKGNYVGIEFTAPEDVTTLANTTIIASENSYYEKNEEDKILTVYEEVTDVTGNPTISIDWLGDTTNVDSYTIDVSESILTPEPVPEI